MRRGAAMLALALLPVGAAAAEKTFVYHLEGPPASLDAAMAASEREHHVLWHLCDALINISKDGKTLEPGLAESWRLSPDGRHATVRLRAGLVFHDGSPIDAHAVRASFERHIRPEHPLYVGEQKPLKARMLEDLLAAVDVEDARTVAFRLRYPGFHYLSQIEIINPAKLAALGAQFARRPDCSGPFRFVSWTDKEIVLGAHPAYWGGRPAIDRLVFRFVPDGREVVDALLKGEVHFSPGLPDPVFFERLRDSERVKLVAVPGLNVFYLGFYVDVPPVNNTLVRRAVAHAINVSRMALFLGRGAVVSARGPLPPPMKGYDATVSQLPYDPDAARRLLTTAGVANDVTLRLVHNSAVAFQAELASAIQSDLKKIGLKVDLVGKPTWRDVTTAARAREGHMFIYGWNVRAPYPERLLVPLFHARSIGSSNLTQYANPRVDTLLDEATQLPDGPLQAKLYSDAQQLVVDDAPMVFLYHAIRMAAHSARVAPLELNLGALPHDKLLKVDVP